MNMNGGGHGFRYTGLSLRQSRNTPSIEASHLHNGAESSHHHPSRIKQGIALQEVHRQDVTRPA
ncbi:MAG: hypothetical protein ACOC0P_08165, partial [Planctomycetota bacterium]